MCAKAKRPRGVAAVLVAIVLVILGGFLALALNAGHLFSVRGELQSAADSGALAGAQQLDGTVGRIPTASPIAVDFAERHRTDTDTPVAAWIVEVGNWDRTLPRASAFTAMSGPWTVEDAGKVNAVRVRLARADGAPGGGPVPVAFGKAFLGGKEEAGVVAEAVAATGPPAGFNCLSMPIALAECGLLGPGATLKCDEIYYVNMKEDGDDTGAWTPLDTKGATPEIRALIEGAAEGTSCKPSQAGEEVIIDDSIKLINGQINDACHEMYKYRSKLIDRIFVVPVVDGECVPCKAGPAGCFSIKYNQTHTVVGFASIRIERIPDCGGTDKTITVRFVCGQSAPGGQPGGTGSYGTWIKPMLVR